MHIIRFSLQNPLIINLSLLILLGVGIISWYSMPREIFPVVALDMVHIKTEFKGASPLEVEQQITVATEDLFKNSQDIDYISSNSSENFSNIYIKTELRL